MKTHCERRLPHIVPPGATVFFTFRLAGSIAAATWQHLFVERELALREASKQTDTSQPELTSRLQKRHFVACDALLDQAGCGPTWLREATIAELLVW
jgi:putative transposase